MKKHLPILIIALFVAALWIPLLCTPLRFQQERETVRAAEKRVPAGALSYEACGRSMKRWVRDVQAWFQDAFAFRKELMRLYNLTHYLLQNYPDEVFGAKGVLFQRSGVVERLTPLTEEQKKGMRANLRGLRQLCNDQGLPCIFMIIPSKLTVYPQWTPRWFRSRNDASRRHMLNRMLRDESFPVYDLTEEVVACAQRNEVNCFLRLDAHWNVIGALYGYQGIMNALETHCSEARTITEDLYSVSEPEDVTWFASRRYLDFLLSEPHRTISRLDLPPVRMLSDGKAHSEVVFRVPREVVTESFCPELGSQTVLFMRDSFLMLPSILLNHSVPHAVYLNFSEEGRSPQAAVEKYHPDLLVYVLQERSVKEALLQMKGVAGDDSPASDEASSATAARWVPVEF